MTVRAVHLLDDDGGYEFRRWSLAALIVLAAHLGLMGTYFLFYNPVPAGNPEGTAIIVNLLPPSAPSINSSDVEPGPPVEEVTPPPEPQVMDIKPPEPIIEPPPPVPMESPVVLTPEPPKPQEVEKPKEPPLPESKKVEHKKPAPKKTAAPRSERAGQQSAQMSGSAGSDVANWSSDVSSRLRSAKRYPSGAESRREQGVVMLRFTLSRNGGVLSRSITRGSGYSELDQEALAMVQRAAPFPPMPASLNLPSFTFTVPVNFSAR